MTTLYCADWVLPIAVPAIEGGAVAVEGARILAVGPRAQVLKEFAEARVCEFGEAVILPGLVNCHSHLELTAMRGFLEDEEGDFKAWLRKITTARAERMTEEDLYFSALSGAVEAARAGVTCLGDASDAAATSMRALREIGLRGIVYQEAFGPDPRLAHEKLAMLSEKVARLRELESELVRAGVSPHAPYSVSGPLIELIAEFALAEKLPVMMHAAESEAEALFMLEGRGAFAEDLARRGIEWRAPGIPTVQYLERHGLLRARPLLAHCIRVDEADIETLKERDARVAHCPKSNAKLGHGLAPFARFLEKELKVGLGSDSVASNNLCDLLEEARFAALLSRARESWASAHRIVHPAEVLRAATLGGAQALGLEEETGSLGEGLQADLTVISMKGAHQLPLHDLEAALVFSSSGRDVLQTIVAGKTIYADNSIQTLDEPSLRARLGQIALNVNRES